MEKHRFFKMYKDKFEELYLTCDDVFLSEINKRFVLAINKILNIETPIIDSRELSLKGDATERLIEACKKLEATVYVSGPAAKAYIRNELFCKNNIEIEWMDYSGYPEYYQMSKPFEHGVSILDLIFNEGDLANTFLKSFK